MERIAVAKAYHLDLPAEEYHARPEWSHSQLKYLPDSPEEFWGRFVAKGKEKPVWVTAFEPTRAMELGTTFHGMLLEKLLPPVVPANILASNGAMTTTAAKQFKLAFPNYVKPQEYECLKYAVDRCHADPEIAAYLDTEGFVEHSLFWTDEATGLDCRARLDKLCRFGDGLEILDLKFSGGTDQRWVEAQVAKMLYFRQAAFYTDAVQRVYGPVNAFTFLFVRNDAPYDAYLWRINPNDLDMGRRRNALALADLAARLQSNNWRSEKFGRINHFTLPKWVMDGDNSMPSLAAFAEFEIFTGELADVH
jgi:hypothetical protein